MEYTDYALPVIDEEAELVPGAMYDKVEEAVKDAFRREIVVSCGARIAYVYDRKAFATLDSIPGHRNTSYGSDIDDVIVQLSIRVDGRQLRRLSGVGLYDVIHEVEEVDREARMEEAKAKAQEAKEAYEASLAALSDLGGSL